MEYSELLKRASTLAYDIKTKLLVALCLIRIKNGLANIANIAVHPVYQRRGLATKMIKKAISGLYGEYSLIDLGVAIGNPAESVYFNLGFLPGIVRYSLYIPAI